MSLKIVVVGGGIAGLVAAISLRHAGHAVIVLEKYDLSSVVGAAIQVTPNGHRVLAYLGFDANRARACRPKYWDVLRGDNLQPLSSMKLSTSPGHPEPGTLTIHRADLHQELLLLASTNTAEDESWGPPVELRGNTAVRSVSDDGMGVILENGEEVLGDLIVGSDGLHSVVRKYVAQESGKAVHSGMAAFRFLLESSELQADAELASMLEESRDVVNLLADTTDTQRERHMIWYACHGGEMQNFVGICPSTSTTIEDASDELKTAMAIEFGHFHPKFQKIISLSSHMKRWPLFIHDPLPRWFLGRVVLIGDAVHPMLPFSGQGASQAMEDGAALGFLFKNQHGVPLESTLSSFEAVRKNRVSRVQVMSTTRAGEEYKIADKIKPYLDEMAPTPPKSLAERAQHDFSYDVYAACAQVY